MNKKDVTVKMSKDAGITTMQAEKAFNTLMEEVKDALKRGERVTFSRFGSFEVKKRKARKGRNPKTGEGINIPQKNRIKFTPSKLFQNSI